MSEGDYSEVWHPLVKAAASMGGITMARKIGDYLSVVEEKLEAAIWVKKELLFNIEKNDVDHSEDAPGIGLIPQKMGIENSN